MPLDLELLMRMREGERRALLAQQARSLMEANNRRLLRSGLAPDWAEHAANRFHALMLAELHAHEMEKSAGTVITSVPLRRNNEGHRE